MPHGFYHLSNSGFITSKYYSRDVSLYSLHFYLNPEKIVIHFAHAFVPSRALARGDEFSFNKRSFFVKRGTARRRGSRGARSTATQEKRGRERREIVFMYSNGNPKSQLTLVRARGRGRRQFCSRGKRITSRLVEKVNTTRESFTSSGDTRERARAREGDATHIYICDSVFRAKKEQQVHIIHDATGWISREFIKRSFVPIPRGTVSAGSLW